MNMKLFDYKILEVSSFLTDLQDQLNALGNEGWELMSILDTEDKTKKQYIFKREKNKRFL